MRKLLAAAIRALALASLTALSWPNPAWPQSGRTIRIVISVPPGGSIDHMARILADHVSSSKGHPVIVESRPGAGGVIAAEAVARAPPDGATLLINNNGMIISSLLRKVSYDPQTSFEPICYLVTTPQLIVVNSASPYHALAQLVDAARATAALDAWGWRIPFLLGLLVGIAGYVLRRYVLEAGVAEKRIRTPIVETLHDHWRLVAGFAGLSAFSAVTFYIGFVYMVSWLQTADGISPSRSLEINTFSMASSLPVLITAGCLSDRIGRKPLMLLASMGGLIGALPLFWYGKYIPVIGRVLAYEFKAEAAIGTRNQDGTLHVSYL